MSTWLRMWSWRIQESAAPNRPKWLHTLVCPFCHGLKKWVRQQQRERAAS